MSKITNNGLTRSGKDVAVPIMESWNQWISKG